MRANILGSIKVVSSLGTLTDLTVPFVQAKHFTHPPQALIRKVDLIVLHTMEAPETVQTATNVARWFSGNQAPQASAHFCVDESHVVQCVGCYDVAWHAPGANGNGIGVEQAGYARMTGPQWGLPKSAAMLRNAASLVARLCLEYSIPADFIQEHDLVAGNARGITTHAQVTQAFHRSTHTDPGEGYPIDDFVGLVGTVIGLLVGAPVKPSPVIIDVDE